GIHDRHSGGRSGRCLAASKAKPAALKEPEFCYGGCQQGGRTMADTIVFAGNVDWSGENPGISLKEKPDGAFVTLASFFRVVLSPHGRGHALVLLRSPQEANPPADRSNLCL